MPHIRNLSAGRNVPRTERSEDVALAVTPVSPKFDLFADLNNAFSLLVYRKKFEPIPG